MANLQATLRSQYAGGAGDPARMLECANRLFFASTPGNRYATLFLAEFSQATRELRYVNCGHVPPVLARADGAMETLAPTATVIGLFEEWFGESAVTVLEPGDTLVVCSDGVTEALSDDEEEYGEDRLRDAVAAHRGLAVPELLRTLQTAVQQFAGAVQSDDLTLLVARALPASAPAAEAAGASACKYRVASTKRLAARGPRGRCRLAAGLLATASTPSSTRRLLPASRRRARTHTLRPGVRRRAPHSTVSRAACSTPLFCRNPPLADPSPAPRPRTPKP